MQYRVGRITLALTLIAVGALLVYDNLTGATVAGHLFRLWPALLILLGLEWIHAVSRSDQRVRTDGGAITLLIISAFLMATVGSAYRSLRSWDFNFAAPLVPFSDAVLSRTVSSAFEAPTGTTASQLVLKGGSASVQVEPGEKLHLDLTVGAYGRTPEEAERNSQLITLDFKPGDTTTAELRIPSGIRVQTLQIRAVVPNGVSLKVVNSSGSVQVRELDAPVKVESSSGAVQVEKVTGSVDLQSSSGAIMAADINGPLKLVSSSGSIRSERVTGDVSATSSSGSITLTDPTGKVTASASSGSVTVVAAQVGGAYDLSATSGSVRLTVAGSAPITVNARASSGTVSGPSWLILGEGRGSGTGTQGDGTFPITLRTSSGSIRLMTH